MTRILRRSVAIVGATAFALSAAACSNGGGAPSSLAAAASAAGGTSTPTATPAAAPAATPTAAPAATPTLAVASAAAGSTAPADVTFVSDAYRYQARIPGDLAAGAMVAATDIWDGTGQIDSTGPRTDHAYLTDQRLVFSYGAPTDLDLEAFAAASQAQKATWHGCPSKPESSTPLMFGGTPAILASFTCGGLHILSVYAVRDGFGLVVNLMNPPGHEPDDRAVLDRLLAGWSWSS